MKEKIIRILDRALGFYGSLMHWDTLVLDRWLWLRKFYEGHPPEYVLDVGCGGGAFTIGLSRLGHRTLGLTYDAPSHAKANERTRWYKGKSVRFQLCDVRQLDAEPELRNRFDSVICLECIEHILDDGKLMRDMAACLKPGGRLYLTAPNIDYIPITPGDAGPFPPVETGWHVRKGYGKEEIEALCRSAGLEVVRISFCSGYLSQKVTWLLRTTERFGHLLALGLILPLRIFPPLLDPAITRLTQWPGYSICLEAGKSGKGA